MSAERQEPSPTSGIFEADPRELYDLAPCALLSTLPTGEIVRANRTLFDWLGTSPADVLGAVRFQSLLTVGSRIYYETHYAPLLLMQGFVSEIALEVTRSDGTTCPVVASATQLRDRNGVPTVNHVALFDSTHRRRYEQELLQARKRAEEVSRQLEAADRHKNDFIAMLAHELRNPLGAIRTAVELQRRRATPAAVDKTSEMMHRQVSQVVRLVEDLLDMTRIAQGKLAVLPVPVDLASVVHHAIEESADLIKAAGLELELKLDESPIYASADAGRLIQVIGNILHNAVKFTPAPGRVVVTLERVETEARITIRDTGIGIDAAKLKDVFGLFMQAAPSPDRTGGLGLGLTLSKTLVERNGGRITVTSEGLGTGSEFIVYLPALSEAPKRLTSAMQPRSSPVVIPQRILIVDDNRDSTELVSMLLQLSGHEVREAHDGVAAVEMVNGFQPELVLLDIGLPRLNGYEVAERIRAQAAHQPTLVALTGWGQEEDFRRSERAGFDAHLVKPLDFDALARLIAELPPPR